MYIGTAERGVAATTPATALVETPSTKKRATRQALAEALHRNLLLGLSFWVKLTQKGKFKERVYRIPKGATIDVHLGDNFVGFTASCIGDASERGNQSFLTFQTTNPESVDALHAWALQDMKTQRADYETFGKGLVGVQLFTPFYFLKFTPIDDLRSTVEGALKRNLRAGNTAFWLQPSTGQMSATFVVTTLHLNHPDDVSDVKVTGAWTEFKLRGKPYRTTTIESHRYLLVWALSSPEDQRCKVSPHKDHKGLCGPSKVRLYTPAQLATVG